MKFSPKKSVYARTLTSLTALAMFVALTGCSNTDDAAPDLQETTDASDSDPTEYIPASEEGPAQNVQKPRLPAEANEHFDTGAQATLKYFWEAEAYASLTGDSNPLALVSSEDCSFCEESVEGWPDNYEKGYWSVMHGDLEVEVTEVVSDAGDDELLNVAQVYFLLTEPPTDFYSETGEHLDGSFSTSETQEWVAELAYDATAQSWQIEWVGLEDSVVWDES